MATITGAGAFEAAKNTTKGYVHKYWKRNAIALLELGWTHVCFIALTSVTNSKTVIKYVLKVHRVTSYIYRCVHDSVEIPFIIIDLAIFGEYVPSCPDDGYQIFK